MTSNHGSAAFSASKVERAAQAATAAAVCAFSDALLCVGGVSLLLAAMGVVCHATALSIYHAR